MGIDVGGQEKLLKKRVLKPDEVVRVFKETHIPTIEEVVERVGRRYKRLRPRKRGKKGLIEFELQRLQLVYNIIKSVFEKLASLPPTNKMNEFHKTLIEEIIGDDYNKAVERARYAIKIIEKIWDDYRLLIATAETPAEAARLRKEAVGRIMSVWRRYKRHIDKLMRVKEEIIKTHVISEDLPVIVIAGIPSAGKSTLISLLSTAKPEIAPYPFTTKNIIVGKMRCTPFDVYLVDTPGILDRPYEELNEIERKAYIALRTLPNLVVFLVDVSPERTVDIEGQLNLLLQIEQRIAKPRGAELIVVINKIDVKDEDAYKRVREWLNGKNYRYLEISAKQGTNINALQALICREAVSHYTRSLGLGHESQA